VRLRLLVALACLGAVAVGLAPAHAARGGGAKTLAGATASIWPLGDSITFGASAQPAPGGYRTSLDQMLTRAGVDHQFVGSWTANSSPTLDLENENRHDGHGGYRVDQIRRDLDGTAHGPSDMGGYWLTGRKASAGLSPDVVLIHLGTNDIIQRWDTRLFPTRDHRADLSSSWQRVTFVNDLSARLADLVTRLHALRPHALVVLSTVVPIDIAAFAETAALYADSVRRLVVQLNARHVPVALADAYAAYVSTAPPGSRVAPGLMSNDGIHPTPAGYALLARVFATVLEGRTLPVPA
jgi:lysophospholipase L1-like esterase